MTMQDKPSQICPLARVSQIDGDRSVTVASRNLAEPNEMPVPDKRQLRIEMNSLFRTEQSLREFVLDFFPEVIKALPDSTSRVDIINKLFTIEYDNSRIWAALQRNSKCRNLELGTNSNNVDRIVIDLTSSESVRWAGMPVQEIVEYCWGSGCDSSGRPIEMHCHWRYPQQEELARALLRLAIHGGVRTLCVENHRLWYDRHKSDLGNCIGLINHDWQADPGHSPSSHAWRFQEIDRAVSQDGMESANELFSNGPQLAKILDELMDKWILEWLNNEFDWVFTDPLRLGIPYHQEYLDWMKKIWPQWRLRLGSSPELLHHVLCCALISPESTKAQAVAGSMRAGPKTVKECLLPAIAFAMVIDAALVPFEAHVNLKQSELPGNFEFLNDRTQLLGLVAVDRQLLATRLLQQSWATPIVLLPHEQRSLGSLRNHRRMGTPQNALERLTRKPCGEILITRDPEMITLFQQPPEHLGRHIIKELQEIHDRLEAEVRHAVEKAVGRQ